MNIGTFIWKKFSVERFKICLWDALLWDFLRVGHFYMLNLIKLYKIKKYVKLIKLNINMRVMGCLDGPFNWNTYFSIWYNIYLVVSFFDDPFNWNKKFSIRYFVWLLLFCINLNTQFFEPSPYTKHYSLFEYTFQYTSFPKHLYFYMHLHTHILLDTCTQNIKIWRRNV